MGYTGRSCLDQRLNEHWSDKGHLNRQCYSDTCKIDCMKFKTCSDAIVYECWAINKYKPKWNKQSKKNDALTIKIDIEENWKLYKTIREVKPIKYESTGFVWKSIAFIYVLYMLLKVIGII